MTKQKSTGRGPETVFKAYDRIVVKLRDSLGGFNPPIHKGSEWVATYIEPHNSSHYIRLARHGDLIIVDGGEILGLLSDLQKKDNSIYNQEGA